MKTKLVFKRKRITLYIQYNKDGLAILGHEDLLSRRDENLGMFNRKYEKKDFEFYFNKVLASLIEHREDEDLMMDLFFSVATIAGNLKIKKKDTLVRMDIVTPYIKNDVLDLDTQKEYCQSLKAKVKRPKRMIYRKSNKAIRKKISQKRYSTVELDIDLFTFVSEKEDKLQGELF